MEDVCCLLDSFHGWREVFSEKMEEKETSMSADGNGGLDSIGGC